MVSGGAPETLERKVYFYRVDVGTDEGGQPLVYDPAPALDVIDCLPFTNDDTGRYLFDSDGNALSLRTHSRIPGISVLFGRVRRNALPQLEQAGNVTDLILAADQGLLEETHVAFFPNNIAGAVYNHFGPRASGLGSYLHQKSAEAVPFASFKQLLRAEPAAQLDRLGDLRVLEMTITPAYADIVRQADGSMGDAFEANARLLESPRGLSLVLKSERVAAGGFLGRMGGVLRELLNSDSIREGALRLRARGYCNDTHIVDTLDLLSDKFISTKAIVRMNTRSRALVPGAAFQAIREAYGDLRDELEFAAGVS